MEARVRERHMNRYIWRRCVRRAVEISHFANIENSIAQFRCNHGDFLIAFYYLAHREKILFNIRGALFQRREIEREIKGKF